MDDPSKLCHSVVWVLCLNFDLQGGVAEWGGMASDEGCEHTTDRTVVNATWTPLKIV